MSQADVRRVYSRGIHRIPTTYWRVERVYPHSLRTVGYITVYGRMVERAMDATRSIHHYEPGDIARSIAHRRYPDYAICVTPVERIPRRWRQ